MFSVAVIILLSAILAGDPLLLLTRTRVEDTGEVPLA